MIDQPIRLPQPVARASPVQISGPMPEIIRLGSPSPTPTSTTTPEGDPK